MVPAVSAVVVNYNTAELTARCVASLRAQRVRGPGGTQGVEVIVVDNASRPEERDVLGGLDAFVLLNDRNVGYGTALNQGTRRSAAPFVLFSNSDTSYQPAALQHLVDAIVGLPKAGAVGPRFWWDPEGNYLQPPADPVTLVGQILDIAAARWPRWRRPRARSWQRRAVRFWETRRPIAQKMLCGASILTSREVLATCGGFDEEFRLYYEDTDWCLRLRKAGYRMYMVPASHVMHLYNQSARQQAEASESLFSASAERYFGKHYGASAWRLISWARRQASSRDRGWKKDWSDLGRVTNPPEWSLPTADGCGRYVALFSPLPSCVPAFARFLTAPTVSLPRDVWDHIASGDFYMQLVSLPDFEPLGKWSWTK